MHAVPVDNARNPSMPLLKLHPLHWANGWGDQFPCAESTCRCAVASAFVDFRRCRGRLSGDDPPKAEPSPFRCARLSRYDASSGGSGEAMRRRDFITLFGGAAAAWPLAGLAQQAGKLPTIGFLGADASAFGPWTAAFVAHLRELGWIEGRTIAIEYRWSQGRTERYAEIAAEFVRMKVDVIVTVGSAVPTESQATSVIPIVFAVAIDPVGSGLVASLAKPGGNVTGLSLQAANLAGKRIELLREVVPQLS